MVVRALAKNVLVINCITPGVLQKTVLLLKSATDFLTVFSKMW